METVAAAAVLTAAAVLWPSLRARTAARVEAYAEWRDVRLWLQAERYDYLVEDGGRLWETLRSDFRFLFDYAYALHRSGAYERSNEVLRCGMRLSSDPMFYDIAGKNYEALGDAAAAERCYLQAHRMIPSRLYPLYLLARLYASTGRAGEARALARQALGRRPRIESVQTREMGDELRRMLDDPSEIHTMPCSD